MDRVTLIKRAQAGDADAFTDLVRRYQEMAFGYAYANLHDFHLAEDIVQQAFVVAYNNLSRLEHPKRFGGWLRGIVRFECLHLLRSRREMQMPIEIASDIAAKAPGPVEIAEEREGFDSILAAINGLPQPEREATILFYVHDHSQRDVAEFLNLSVTTVNNRLRTARKRLKTERLHTMTHDAFGEHSLPDDFAARIGEIVRVQGSVIDARFDGKQRPSILSKVAVTDDASRSDVTADVIQHLGDDLIRCVVTGQGRTVTAADHGLRVVATEEPTRTALDPAFVSDVIASMRRPANERSVIETGIKAIDVLSPLPTGGVVGLIGDAQTGKMVLVEELIHRLADASNVLSIIVFVGTPAEVSAVRSLEYRTSATVEAIYLPVEDASASSEASITGELDAVMTFSRHLAEHGLYPAIDPLMSTSRMLDPEIVGQVHDDVAQGIRQLIARAAKISSQDQAPDAMRLKHRAGLVQRFLTQPFFVAEPFTKRAGLKVSQDAAVQDCKALLEGKHDDLPKDALYMTGGLDGI